MQSKFGLKCVGLLNLMGMGGLILSIDRIIVMTISSNENLFKKLLTAIPRIALAIIIGMSISKPIEIAIFADEIDKLIDKNKKLEIEREFNITKEKLSNLTKKYIAEINSIEKQIEKIDSKYDYKTLKDEIEYNRKKAKIKEQEYFDECNGKGKMGKKSKIAECGSNARMLKNEQIAYEEKAKSLSLELSKIQEENNNKYLEEIKPFNIIKKKINEQYLQEKEKIYKDFEQRKENLLKLHNTSFISRYSAMNELINNNISLKYVNIFIMLLFIIIEVSPVLVKLLSQKGPYDIFIEKEIELAKERYDLYKEKMIAKFKSYYKVKKDFFEKVSSKSENEVEGYISKLLNDTKKVLNENPLSSEKISKMQRLINIIIVVVILLSSIYYLYTIEGYDLKESGIYVLMFFAGVYSVYRAIYKYYASGELVEINVGDYT